MNKILKTLSFGLIMSSVVMAQENTEKNDVFKANNSLPPTWDSPFKTNNSLPPTWDGPFKTNNSLPPTWEGPFKANNSLPPTWDLCTNVKAQKISSQNAMAMRYMQMQRQHTRV